jgi:hypothetical protein
MPLIAINGEQIGANLGNAANVSNFDTIIVTQNGSMPEIFFDGARNGCFYG